MTTEPPIVGVTMGDPAGIGSEILVKAYPGVTDEVRMVALGDADVVETAVDDCGSDLAIRSVESVEEARYEPGTLDVLDFDSVGDLQRGEHRGEYGAASLEYVERGIELAMEGRIDAMSNAPINKKALSLAGSDYAGHTNLLADRTGTDNYSMMLIEEELCVTHVTVHVSLQEAIDAVTADEVLETIETTERGIRQDLGVEDPSIAVAGLNPHAGEGGVIGDEDEQDIVPAVERAQDAGIDASGPWAPDIVFNQAAVGRFDAVVAMYHDQGHIAVYARGMLPSGTVGSVNMTIGLPIVRTSTVHGTGFDIAGEGIADETGIANAIRTAARAAAQRTTGSAAG